LKKSNKKKVAIETKVIQPEATTAELHLVEYASIPKAPNHSRNHVLADLMGDGLVDESPTVVASQCTGFP